MDQKLLQARPCRNRSTKKVTWSVARGVSSPVTRHTCSTVQYSTVQYSTVKYSTVKYRSIQAHRVAEHDGGDAAMSVGEPPEEYEARHRAREEQGLGHGGDPGLPLEESRSRDRMRRCDWLSTLSQTQSICWVAETW